MRALYRDIRPLKIGPEPGPVEHRILVQFHFCVIQNRVITAFFRFLSSSCIDAGGIRQEHSRGIQTHLRNIEFTCRQCNLIGIEYILRDLAKLDRTKVDRNPPFRVKGSHLGLYYKDLAIFKIIINLVGTDGSRALSHDDIAPKVYRLYQRTW